MKTIATVFVAACLAVPSWARALEAAQAAAPAATPQATSGQERPGSDGARGAASNYRDEILRWRAQREARLKADGGWLTVAGLFWLESGENAFGTDPAGKIVLPAGSAPAEAGVVEPSGKEKQATVRLAPGVQATLDGQAVRTALLRADSTGAPNALVLGRVSLHLIERGGRLAIRMKDQDARARREFTGLSWFDVDEKYRVEARWVPYAPGRSIKVPNVLGRSEPMPSPGRAEFVIGGQALSLDGVLEADDAQEIFFIFRDRTSGVETYGAGRFLYAALPKDGKLTLDFNKAYNPPCAFTAFATCPLPPPQNALAVRVEAGEKNYGHGH